MMARLGIRPEPNSFRLDGKLMRGYHVAGFRAAFARYFNDSRNSRNRRNGRKSS
jgi:hypothetical protein